MHAKATTGPIAITLAINGDSPLPEAVRTHWARSPLAPMAFSACWKPDSASRPETSPLPTRLIQYLGCIDQVNRTDTFYHESYEADPFSVARTLLQWRDQWYLAGWQRKFGKDVPNRLARYGRHRELASHYR